MARFVAVCVGLFAFAQSILADAPRVLVFTKTASWRHDSIPAGISALKKLGEENNIGVDATEDVDAFREDNLKKYRAIVFLNTTGHVLQAPQRLAMQRFIQAGGGFVGIHSAAATEYDWPWYNQLLGAYLSSHPLNPGVRHGVIVVMNHEHPATRGLPARWERDEEWYSFRNISPEIQVLATLDENSYEGGTNGSRHPIIWAHAFDGGRAFYTALGHQSETFRDSIFLQNLLGGIRYAISDREIDYSRAKAVAQPEEERFQKTTLIDHLRQPMELAVAPDGRVYFTELATGNLYVFDTKTGKHALLHHFDVSTRGGTGLIGVALDPHFDSNGFIYLYYAPPIDGPTIYFQLSRFTVVNGRIDPATEKVYFKVPVLPNGGSHHGGSLAWDRAGNLYLSTGDSTSPAPADGYAPLDERPGQEHVDLDAQRSAGNTNDLKGKILRIHPELDGTYTIPAGNLFAPGAAKTRPEIYILGCRNPYRIAVNPDSSVLYWGDIGPDAGVDSPRGPKGYDEFNQARSAGNFGWPYFEGDNQAYPKWNYDTGTPGEKQKPEAPRNLSPNNTGLIDLPPAQPAMIWYPYAPSKEFPLFGQSGRSAMAGEFYKWRGNGTSSNAIPAYYDRALFVFDWMRNWVMALRFDASEKYIAAEPFMPNSGDFRRPIDLAFGPDGAMYLLEYGSVYGADNPDARLTRVEYISGARPLTAKAGIVDAVQLEKNARHNARVHLTSEQIKGVPTLNRYTGAAPLRLAFTGEGSVDPDGEAPLGFHWKFGSDGEADGKEVEHEFAHPGKYRVILAVQAGAKTATSTVDVEVGNDAPSVHWNVKHNTSFFWPNDKVQFNVSATDREDGDLTPDLKVTLQYRPEPPFNITQTEASSAADGQTPLGAQLMSRSDCRACHVFEKTLVGPGFAAVAQRYKEDPGAVQRLGAKIIKGGAGNWGETPMAAHPQIAVEDAEEIARYILSSAKDGLQERDLGAAGEIVLNLQTPTDPRPEYTFKATVTDHGSSGLAPLTTTSVFKLRAARERAALADEHIGFQRYRDNLGSGGNKSYLKYNDVDLSSVAGLAIGYSAAQNGEIEVHLDSFAGPVVGTAEFSATSQAEATALARFEGAIEGRHDLYIVFRRRVPPDDAIITPQWIEFRKE